MSASVGIVLGLLAGLACGIAVAAFTMPAMLALWPVDPGPRAALLAGLGAVAAAGALTQYLVMMCALAIVVTLVMYPLARMLIAIEVIPDIFRTVGKVTADLAVTTIVARREPAVEQDVVAAGARERAA